MPVVLTSLRWGDQRHLLTYQEQTALIGEVLGPARMPAGLLIRVNKVTKPLLQKLGVKLPEKDD